MNPRKDTLFVARNRGHAVEFLLIELCSIDQIAPCSGPSSGETWKNHGQYVSAVAPAAPAFLEQGLISEAQADEIVGQAAQSDCGFTNR